MDDTELLELRTRNTGLRLQAYDKLAMLSRDSTMLRAAGYADIGAACTDIISRTARQVEANIRAFEQKHPD